MQIAFIVAHILEAVGMYLFYSSRYKSKTSKRVEVMTIFITYAVLFGVFLINDIFINATSNLIIVFIISLVLFNITKIDAIIQSLFYLIITTSSELLVSSLLGICSPEYEERMVEPGMLLLFVICNKLVAIIVVILLTNKCKENNANKYIVDRAGVFFLILFTLTVFVLLLLIYFGYNIDMSDKNSRLFSVLACFVFVEALISLGIFNYYKRKTVDYYETTLLYQIENNRANYYEAMIESDKNKNVLIHDIKNHLYVIEGLCTAGKQEEVAIYVRTLLKDVNDNSAIAYSDSEVLNFVINRYVKQMDNLDIDYNIDIRGANSSFMEDTDITSLFSNMYENAIEASRNSINKSIDLRIMQDSDRKLYCVIMENSCNEAPKIDKNGKLVSNKKQYGHGFGSKSIELIVKKYNGNVEYSYNKEEQRFITKIICSSDTRL